MPLNFSLSAMGLLTFLVALLGAATVAAALTVYLLMEFRSRRDRDRATRRLMMTTELFPLPPEADVTTLWRRSGRVDRGIIEDILADQTRLLGETENGPAHRAIMASGIFEQWLRQLKNGRTSGRVRAAIRLGYLREPRGVEGLVLSAHDPTPEVQLAVTLSLGRLGDARGLAALMRVASQPPPWIPDFTLCGALAACAKDNPLPLTDLLRADSVRSRLIGAWALSEVGDPRVLPQLLVAARDPEAEVRAKVARALGRISQPDAIEALISLVQDRVWFVRVRALDALGRLRATSTEGVMVAALGDRRREVQYRAAFALRQIIGANKEAVARLITSVSPRRLGNLISEWDRAGFLWDLIKGLSPADREGIQPSYQILRALIGAGLTSGLVHLVEVFPDRKVRLRLLRVLLEARSNKLEFELHQLAKQPGCDHRLAAKIERALATPG